MRSSSETTASARPFVSSRAGIQERLRLKVIAARPIFQPTDAGEKHLLKDGAREEINFPASFAARSLSDCGLINMRVKSYECVCECGRRDGEDEQAASTLE
jgi:hypothetical protein